MPNLPRFSRRALLRSLPLALPLLYGCGGGSGEGSAENTTEPVSRAAAPLVVGGETIAQLRLVQTKLSYRSRGEPLSFATRLFVENTGTRTIADLQFSFINSVGSFSDPIVLSALGPGQVYQKDDFPPYGFTTYQFITNIETLVSRLRFAGEPALGSPYSGIINGNLTVTDENNRTGRVYAIVGIDNRVRGSVYAQSYEPTPGNPGAVSATTDAAGNVSYERFTSASYGSLFGTVDATGGITATLKDNQQPAPSALSGALRTEGDGFRFEFSAAPNFAGKERFSAFLRREAG